MEINKMKEQVQEWLKGPHVETGQELLQHLQMGMQSEDNRAELGPLLGSVRSTLQHLQTMEQQDWIRVGKGRLAIGHRPSRKLATELRLQGATAILTLLSDTEGAEKIENVTVKEGLSWIWFPMKTASPPAEDRLDELKSVFAEMELQLESGGSIYTHCSAGIHRTGMITLAFLKYVGLTDAQALDLLQRLRGETARRLGGHRQDWALRVDLK
jgi:protein-tyrosine phosphatase